MEIITLADETVLENAYIVRIDNETIAAFIAGSHTMGEIYAIFGTETKTREIQSNQYGNIENWDGYTEPVSIQIQETQAIVCLRK